MDNNKTEVISKIDAAFTKFPKRSYPKGQILVFADENPEHIFYVVSGRVRKYDISYRGDEVIVNIFQPPAFFPMSWAINHTRNRYFYKTETETELHIVPVEVALQFIKTNPDVMLDLLSRIYKGMDGLLGRAVHLMSGTAKSRLIYELIIECRRFGQAIPSSLSSLQPSPHPTSKSSYLLSTNEVDIAARTGLSRETVSREIHKLKHANLISVNTKGLVIEDLPALEALLGSEI